MSVLEWCLFWSVIANIALLVAFFVAWTNSCTYLAKYEEYRTTAIWMRDAANAQGKLEVSDRWNTYLRARLDLAAGLNEDVGDILKDEEEDE